MDASALVKRADNSLTAAITLISEGFEEDKAEHHFKLFIF